MYQLLFYVLKACDGKLMLSWIRELERDVKYLVCQAVRKTPFCICHVAHWASSDAQIYDNKYRRITLLIGVDSMGGIIFSDFHGEM